MRKGDRDWQPSSVRNAYRKKKRKGSMNGSTDTPQPQAREDHTEGSDQDSPGTPYFLRPIVIAEQEERRSARITPQDYGTRWQSAYRSITGNRPLCGPKDYGAANLYLSRIRAAMAEGGWSPGEWGRLHTLEETWRKRAEGKDPVFEVMGNRGGRMSEGELQRVETVRRMIEIGELANGQRKKMR